MFSVLWEKSFSKDLDKITEADAAKIFKIVEQLAYNPRPPASKKLSLKASLYRIRHGDYRIIYEIKYREKEVKIIFVRHRKEAYRQL